MIRRSYPPRQEIMIVNILFFELDHVGNNLLESVCVGLWPDRPIFS